MRELSLYSTVFLSLISAIIIALIHITGGDDSEGESIKTPRFFYTLPEESYQVYKIDEGHCADRVVRSRYTYVATYCAGEFGQIPINIPHHTHLDWDPLFGQMIQEVDSLSGKSRASDYGSFWKGGAMQ